jgi:Protein of unknown function (DUF3631)/Bifunctional DNA primase/polymerase, N-terminal
MGQEIIFNDKSSIPSTATNTHSKYSDVNLDAALELAAAGIPVFPATCRCTGSDKWQKQPLVDKWQQAATTDPQQIRTWWRVHPNAVPGIELGRAGLVVVDADRHGGPDGVAALAGLASEHCGLPFGPMTATAGGGEHHVFRQPDGRRFGNRSGALPAGIDVRGAGGWIVAPGSVRPDGARWEPADGTPSLADAFRSRTIPTLPEWIGARIYGGPQRSLGGPPSVETNSPTVSAQPHRNGRHDPSSGRREGDYARAALDGCARELARAGLGERNNMLNSSAYRMGRMAARGWIEGPDIADALWEACEINGLVRDDGIDAVQATLASGVNAGVAEPHPDLAERPRSFPKENGASMLHFPELPSRGDVTNWLKVATLRTRPVPVQTRHDAPAKTSHEPPTERSLSNGLPNAATETTDDAELKRLAELPLGAYERQRSSAAKQLGYRTSVLDELVEATRSKDKPEGAQGRPLSLPEPELWPHPVNGTELLDELSASIRRYVIMPDHAADTAALWAIHTYLLDSFGVSPRLAITSPEKGCGKTTALDVMAHLVWRPLPTANASAAAIFRVVEMQRPTLLIDEADTFLPENEELRGILNSGHRRGGSVIRTVGEEFEPRSFSTYSACAVALIGKLPATLADRSVSIELRRRRSDEPIEPFRFERTERLDQLARKAARWVADNADRIRGADPEMPAGVFNRAADNWRPLLAIADAAGSGWPARARGVVLCAEAAGSGEQSARVLLLADVRVIFAERRVDRLASAELVEALVAIEGSPWAEWKAGKPITANSLARLLAPFTIAPETIRVGDRTPKGYQLARFEDAFTRYLPNEGT